MEYSQEKKKGQKRMLVAWEFIEEGNVGRKRRVKWHVESKKRIVKEKVCRKEKKINVNSRNVNVGRKTIHEEMDN